MILRHEGAPLTEPELPKEAMDPLSIAGSRPSTWAMVGHRPVNHCSSGVSVLPLPEHAYPSWQLDELVSLRAVGV